ncbi:uncharacterized protein ACA1_133480 [Acanthamoeba castellanii str. Neff]|uniref:Uncharacterized protein n=1 Tax=Acanthamoeba castellanii (strain ATCC 30010 / Neff) TaxID=1257118 RepID=L8H3P5_ACACF|nr:uncharacterized protein ACA1_133480 [Acanthamoeba castellanii str. Neff]ELR19835.1 hypothetical protein ACA1_133480 [Acanthamoeba castellanii str. Neff]
MKRTWPAAARSRGAGSDCDLWAPLFVRRFGRSPNAERKDQGLIVKMQFMMEVESLKEEKIRQAIEEHNMRIERWKKGSNHNPIAMHSELLPVLKYRDGELQEVSFITAKHMWGLLAWFVPVGVACSVGARPALVATVLCSLTRYYTYDAYYDEAKLQPRPNKDRLRSVAKCLISGIAVCAGAAMLGWASGAGVRASIDKSIQTIIGSA